MDNEGGCNLQIMSRNIVLGFYNPQRESKHYLKKIMFLSAMTPSITQCHSFLLRWCVCGFSVRLYNPNMQVSVMWHYCNNGVFLHFAGVKLFEDLQAWLKLRDLGLVTGKNNLYIYWYSYAAFDCHDCPELCSMHSVLWCKIKCMFQYSIWPCTLFTTWWFPMIFASTEWK